MFATAAIVAVAAVAAFGLRFATRPDTFQVRRSTTVHAAPERIYPLLEDFRRWSAWSPWEKLDPAMKRSFSGSERGQGAIYAWEGNRKAGEGRMEITEAVPPHRLDIDIEFIQPFPARNTIEFRLEPRGSATEVVWEMRGQNNTMSKVMQSVISMDRLVGKDFEAGLAQLKAAAEGSVAAPAARN